jgi:hypothetical protein
MKRSLLFFLTLFLTGYGHVTHAQNLSWSTTKGPYSTTVNAFDTAHGAIFAGTKTGLFESSNGGNVWFAVPSVPGIIYDILAIGTNIYTAGAGITVSTDSGVTWIARDSGLPLFPLVYALKNQHDTLYACMGGEGLFRSIDAGKYWAQPSPDIANKSINTMIATRTSLILAEGAGILRSTNKGFSWDEPSGVIADQAVHVFAMKDNFILAGTEAGVYRSSDDGVTWVESRTGMRDDEIVTSISISADNKTIFAGTSTSNSESGIYLSGDGGNSWQLINTGLVSYSVNSVFTMGSETFAGTALGISRSDNNGDSWHVTSEGLPKQAVLSLVARDYYYILAGTAGSFIFGTGDLGENWVLNKKGLTRPNVNALLSAGGTIFAGTDAQPKQGFGGMHRSTDNAASWSQINSGIPIMSIKSLASYGTNIYGYGDSGSFSSADSGISWNPSSSFVEKLLYSDNSALYVVTNTGILLYTDNGGWAPTGFPQNQNVLSLTKNSKYLYVGTDSGIYRGSNLVWKLVTGDSLTVQSLWSNDNIVVAGTKTGIYASSDNGLTWQYQQSAGAVSVNAFCYGNRNLFAATSAGVIKASLVQFGVQSKSEDNVLSLSATNPSNSLAIIHYRINESNKTSLTAFDLLGRECSRIFSDQRDPGEYNLDWNTSSLASGTYMLRLVSGGKQASAMINVVH